MKLIAQLLIPSRVPLNTPLQCRKQSRGHNKLQFQQKRNHELRVKRVRSKQQAKRLNLALAHSQT